MNTNAFWILCLIFPISFMSPVKASVENKEVDDTDVHFSTCEAESVCGFLQQNTHGISKRHLCKCLKSPCPMKWDANDGFSVTQGSAQYKFCGPPPKLQPCNTTHFEYAFTGRLQYSHITGHLTRSDRLHCACPADDHYYLVPTEVRPTDPGTAYFEWTYGCGPYDECQPGATCMTITENGREYFELNKCNCPGGLNCPATTVNATKRPNSFDGESVYDVKCQN